MNTLLEWAASPAASILWKWTALLALGWLAHAWLRQGHARWRLILWRSMLLFSLALPVASWMSWPSLTIHVSGPAPAPAMEIPSSPTQAKTVAPLFGQAKSPVPAALGSLAKTPAEARPATFVNKPFQWATILMAVWILGSACGMGRLIWFQMRLSGIRKRASSPDAELGALTDRIRARLGARPTLELRLSDEIQSPFVCGLWRPVIMVPRRLAESLSTEEMAALLRHEMAHLRGHDLWWSVGWRWLQAIGWFQPLIWRIVDKASALASGTCRRQWLSAVQIETIPLRTASKKSE